ncbi:MAG: phosphatase PAP2 family protein [Actinomycetota bacterium]|nr:phosphatase PAP2 family protein [Actinomycetota bacterium]
MRRRLQLIEARVLPRGWTDVIRQIALFAAAYVGYQVARGLVGGASGYKPFGDATKIIDLERTLHVFVEPSIQSWARNKHVLMDIANWTYLNSHYVVTLGALAFIYLRRNDCFYFVRNMFMIAMAIALVGYVVYPTAPPRLLPEWGFTDSISQFLGTPVDYGPGKQFLNFYAAVPSMHVCFAIMVGWPMSRLTDRRPVKVLWLLYPLLITFVVVATGNHYLTDVFLGAVTAGASWMLAGRLLARARPDAWRFGQATA